MMQFFLFIFIPFMLLRSQQNLQLFFKLLKNSLLYVNQSNANNNLDMFPTYFYLSQTMTLLSFERANYSEYVTDETRLSEQSGQSPEIFFY